MRTCLSLPHFGIVEHESLFPMNSKNEYHCQNVQLMQLPKKEKERERKGERKTWNKKRERRISMEAPSEDQTDSSN